MSTLKVGFKLDALIKEKRVAKEDIYEIKKWQRTTSYPKLVEEQIAMFLISCNNDQNLVKKTIESYFDVIMGAPNLFCNRDMENLVNCAKVINFAVMPKRLEDSAIIIIKLKDTNYRNYDMLSHFQLSTMTTDSILYDNPPKNIISVSDFTGFSIMHLSKCKLNILRPFTEYNQHGMPIQIKNIHMVNVGYVAHTALQMVKPFLKSNLMEKVIMHRDYNIFDWIPKEYLPKEFGGDLQSTEYYHEEHLKRLFLLKPYFKALENQVYSNNHSY